MVPGQKREPKKKKKKKTTTTTNVVGVNLGIGDCQEPEQQQCSEGTHSATQS
jgi:hypothetical protein